MPIVISILNCELAAVSAILGDNGALLVDEVREVPLAVPGAISPPATLTRHEYLSAESRGEASSAVVILQGRLSSPENGGASYATP